MSTKEHVFTLNEDELFIHFQDNGDSAVMLHHDEDLNYYFRVTHFGADVLAFLQENPGCTFDQIVENLVSQYDSSPSAIKVELQKVIDKFIENSIL